MIINIEPGTFGGPMRMGDLVAVANVVEHLRQKNNDNTIRFFIKPEAISKEEHCQQFHSWMIAMTDYFSAFEGTESLPWRNVNLWDFRDISGDLVKIPNKIKAEFKIVVCPVLDAPYNTYRNWPPHVLQQILEKCEKDYPAMSERILCISPKIKLEGFDLSKWQISTNFLDNINHIRDCQTFIGGDTGTSHFAWSLDSHKELLYYNSSRGLIHTLPFYLMQGKGKMATYWLDFENTKWV